MSLQDIYQEILLAHNRNPNHFESMPDATHQAYGSNPLCGDEVTIFVKIENEVVKAVSFTGEGCAICKASSSLMTDTLCGLSLSNAIGKTQQFIQLLSDTSTPIPNDLGELEALLGVRKFPARLKCATLAWHTFLKAMTDEHR
ncbi:MAG: SUF system NifU family Fe-S cluster assembly protein [Puniceicoccales bacterium]|nr:SUF system NifU family Fe-S cluster assembly protein [Puniceicoccales bacterium]